MSCIHGPVSLADAEQILVCYGGADWRMLFGLGLAAFFVLGFLIIAVIVLVRSVR